MPRGGSDEAINLREAHRLLRPGGYFIMVDAMLLRALQPVASWRDSWHMSTGNGVCLGPCLKCVAKISW